MSTAPQIARAPIENRLAIHQSREAAYFGDFAMITAFAQEFGLKVTTTDASRLLIKLKGTAAAMELAFGTKLWVFRSGNQAYRSRDGVLSLPAPLLNIVSAVLGLETTPIATTSE